MTRVRAALLSASMAGFACATAPTTATPAATAPAAAVQTMPDSGASHDALVRNVERKYPKEGFIVGFGNGQTPEMAEDHARVNAAKAINDVIDANLSVVKEAQGNQAASVHVTDEIRDRVQTDAGPFIEAIHNLTQQSGGNWEAVAVIDRERLDQKYATDSGRLLEAVTLAWDRALAASEKSDTSGAVTALCGIDAQEAALDRIDYERKLVTRRAAWTADALIKRHSIEELRSKLKGARVNVYERAEGGEAFADSLVRKLAGAGYQADLVKEPRCMTGGGLLIQAAVAVNCGPSTLGQRCEAELSATSQRCGSVDSLFDERSSKATGLHATDPDLAKKFALQKLDTKKFVDVVAGRVLGALEGGCKK